MTTDMAMETVMETVMGMEAAMAAATGVTVGTAIEPFSPSRPLGLLIRAAWHAPRGEVGKTDKDCAVMAARTGSACRLANGFLSRSLLENPALELVKRDTAGYAGTSRRDQWAARGPCPKTAAASELCGRHRPTYASLKKRTSA
jgi:hypothetical protein